MLETRVAEVERMIGAITSGTGEFERGDLGDGQADRPVRSGRTEGLINRGRLNGTPKRLAFVREHWKPAAVAAGAIVVFIIVLAVALPGAPAPSWPAAVTRMQSQVSVACANPNVAAEPTQVNFACGKDTRQVLWVFALLTSGGNPGYSDPVTGRRGLEPITPSQGGTVAWSLNLHGPYDPASPADSIEVAARAVNNIVAGATLTSADGRPAVQDGLESSAANCQRYTGSSALRTRSGFPALCAKPLTKAGAQALVTDVFGRWMTGAPAQTAVNAGVLFAHSGDPGDPQVQKILASLPGSRQ